MSGVIEINVQRAIADVQHELGVRASQEQIALAASRAINRAISSARTVAINRISRVYNIDKKFFAEKRGNEKNRYNALLTWKANKNSLTGKINAVGKPIPLIAFPVDVTETGVVVHVKKGSSMELKGVFPAKMKSGHESIFGRGKYSKGVFERRTQRIRPFPLPDLPISQILTTSIRAAVAEPSVIAAMKQKAETTMTKRMKAELSFLLTK